MEDSNTSKGVIPSSVILDGSSVLAGSSCNMYWHQPIDITRMHGPRIGVVCGKEIGAIEGILVVAIV
jgi:hypothetical protein